MRGFAAARVSAGGICPTHDSNWMVVDNWLAVQPSRQEPVPWILAVTAGACASAHDGRRAFG